MGEEGPAPGDCGRYEPCLPGEPIPPEDRELPNDELPASSSCGNGLLGVPLRNDSAAVVGGDGA